MTAEELKQIKNERDEMEKHMTDMFDLAFMINNHDDLAKSQEHHEKLSRMVTHYMGSIQQSYGYMSEKAIEALEQEPCEDKEYEKDLNELKEQILKEGNTLVAKQDLLERFVEIDNEYKHRPWNLLQILANMDILVGEEPCEDCVSRQAVIDIVNNPLNIRLDEIIKKLPPVTPKSKTGHWIKVHPLQADDGGAYMCSCCRVGDWGLKGTEKYCPNYGCTMKGE